MFEQGPIGRRRKDIFIAPGLSDPRLLKRPSRMKAVLGLVLLLANIAAAADEWRVADPDSLALDGARLSALTRDIRAGAFNNIHSVLVIRHGTIAVEEYFEGPDETRGQSRGVVRFDANTLHDIRSITKSVSSLLFGIMLSQSPKVTLDTPVLNFFPEFPDLKSGGRESVRLKHLLTMTAGLKWDEYHHPYGTLLNSETAMDEAPNRYRYVLEQPVVAAPGSKFEYSGGNATLLAAIIERNTKMKLDAYAQKVLFGPLGITRFEWLKYADGTPIAASGLRMLPRDLAKLGLLCLQQGRWGGTQIVPAAWMRDATSAHVLVIDQPTGLQRYGYQWWRGTSLIDGKSTPWIEALGYGGQRILIVPAAGLVAVLTAGNYGNPKEFDIATEILLERILPAVRSR
jgi:CubicO group peptidase (beta-lactamase class C family)